MKPINEAEESLLKSVQRDNKEKRDLVLKILEDMKENIDNVPIYSGNACATCPPPIREEFIDYLMEDKEIIDMFWTYGNEEKALGELSRFYTDLNLHVKVSGYSLGEKVSVLIEGVEDPYGEGVSFEDINVDIEINRENEGVLMGVFKEKKVILFEE